MMLLGFLCILIGHRWEETMIPELNISAVICERCGEWR